MANAFITLSLRTLALSSALFSLRLLQISAAANPLGGTVAQGGAAFHTSGSVETITTAGNTAINWQSFNIGAGETTTFVEPSSSSVVWNTIEGSNPSQILGNLNANGYVILQNQAGFYVGGQAAIAAHGLIMTTAGGAVPNLSSGGAWEFNAPPPTSKIVNYGQVNIIGGGSAFLLASDIENNGTLSAPGGKIGLYAGEQVLVSSAPDGRGLSAVVTLPQGSVDNNGKLIADAGSIAAQAQTVNQNGLIQANTVQNVNGAIELLASDSVNLGANSAIAAKGDSIGVSAGGSVMIKSGNNYADQAGSAIDISGGAQGGNGGQVEISAPQMSAINSTINGQAVSGYVSGELAIDPLNIVLDDSSSDPNAQYSGTVQAGDPPAAGTLNLNINDFSSTLSQINLAAINNITLNTLWSLADATGPSTLTLTAGNSIVLNNNAAIIAGNNWNVTLNAGSGFVASGAQPTPTAGSITSPNYGIYLGDSAFVQTQNGNIILNAANEVQIAADANAGNDGIRTLNGGNIAVTTTYGDVNTGANSDGYQYEGPPGKHQSFLPPYYSVASTVGGISTAAGGNVTIQAGVNYGGNVISYLPGGTTVAADAGTGAFGSQPGNVTITAGGNVYGHYVLANGTGIITAGQNVGTVGGGDAFALSLVAGDWTVNSPNGSIYLQEVRNPRGVFDNTSYGTVAAHTFDYAAQASVTLDAGIGVDLTGVNVPRLSSAPQDQVPVIYPPILDITAGSGGVTLQGNVALFPSVDQSLNITTTGGGNFVSAPNTPGTTPELLMSDSSQISWSSANNAFSDTDHSPGLPVQVGDVNSVVLNINGDMENLNLITSKAAQINVDGNMIGCGFSGQNLHANDVTSITVGGQIYNRGPYDFLYGINIPNLPTSDLLPGIGSSWDNIFTLAVDPAKIASLTVPANTLDVQLAGYALQTASLFGVSKLSNGQLQGNNPGFVYNQTSGQLGFAGDMSSLPSSVLTALTTGSISVLHLVNGLAVMDTNPGDHSPGRTYGQLETDTVSWVNPAAIQTLEQASVGAPSPENPQLGYRVGGPGLFTVNASSIDLGNTYGIISCGVYDPQGGYYRYADLASITPSGATVDVTVTADQTGTVVVDGTTIAAHDSLSMLTSTIAAIGGGNVNVLSTGGSMDLGSADLLGNTTRDLGFGVFTSGNADVKESVYQINVTAENNINIDGSRIATYNGGNILIESLQGNVDAGNGGASYIQVPVSYVDPSTGKAQVYREAVFGSGIVADTLIDPSQVPNSAVVPGNITVDTFQGDIIADLGGILQEALNGNVSSGPTINLIAGTQPSGTPGHPGYSAGHVGNIDLGQSGVIGGTVNATANGNINGLVISRQNSDINAAQNFSGAVLSGGTANVSGGGTVSGVIVGVSGATVTGASGVSAQVLSQNANVGGVAQNTLGATATATATSQSAAGQASSDSKQELANNDTGADDDEKKKQKMQPLMRRIKRVTVILPKT